ncbi:MAG: NmrA family NAD(P)-binding protein [Pseudolabrys sp.]
MAVTNERTVAVFGGTGFLGRRVVRHLRKRGFSVRPR